MIELFIANDLMFCRDVVSFDHGNRPLQKSFLSPRVFESNLLTHLRDNVTAGRSAYTINNAESINNVLKYDLQWQPHQLLDHGDHLQKLEVQFYEVDRTMIMMIGVGDFER